MGLKVGITGQSGFMGSHLCNFLKTKENQIEIIDFKRNFFESDVDLESFVKKCDVIVHIAAMNRHEDQEVIYNTLLKRIKIIYMESQKEMVDSY